MSNTADNITLLQQVFPTIPQEILEKVLSAAKNNVSLAVQSILQAQNGGGGGGGGADEDEDDEDEDALPEGKLSVVRPAHEYSSKCGYCKASKVGRVSYGMEGRRLTVTDYQALIDRGWRRSGTWLYIPSNNHPDCCCPQHTIRLDVTPFVLTKSQKSVVKKMDKYLRGEHVSTDPSTSADADMKEAHNNEKGKGQEKGMEKQKEKETGKGKAKEPVIVDEQQVEIQEAIVQAVEKVKKELPDFPQDVKFPVLVTITPQKKISERGNYSTNVGVVMAGVLAKSKAAAKQATATTPATKKNKQSDHGEGQTIAQKIASYLPENFGPKVVVGSDAFINFHTKNPAVVLAPREKTSQQKTAEKNKQEKTRSRSGSMEDAGASVNAGSVNIRKLEIKMIPSAFSAESYEVYRKYQIAVHHDKPEKVTEEGYTRFLVTSPLVDDVSKSSSAGVDGYGAYHMQYRIDGKLVAVGVVDVLPKCLSGVYFYYDPEYAFLSLGVYSALKEIEWVQNAAQVAPNLHYYYMGYYIHSCPKMRYKGEYHPSDLLCPETLTWVPLTSALPYLEEKPRVNNNNNDNNNANNDSNNVNNGVNNNKRKPIRFNWESSSEDLVQSTHISDADALAVIPKVPIFYEGRIMHYKDFMKRGQEFLRPRITEYIKRVGRELAQNIIYEVR